MSSTAIVNDHGPRPVNDAVGYAEPRHLPVVQHVQLEQRANFSFLQTKPEPLPAWMTRRMRTPVYGMNWKLAQRLPGTPVESWVVPGNGYLCLVEESDGRGIGATCTTTERETRQGLASVVIHPHPRFGVCARRQAFGLVPDRARRVLVYTGGTVKKILVSGHIFSFVDSVGRPPDRPATRSAGHRRMSLSFRSRLGAARCQAPPSSLRTAARFAARLGARDL